MNRYIDRTQFVCRYFYGSGPKWGIYMEQLSLFDDRDRTAPLAARLRPETLDEFVGQEHLLGKGKILRQLIEKDQISSMIFWGPPGVGKTDACTDYCPMYKRSIY